MSATTEPVKIVHFDWAMKALLRDKANFSILEGFLQSLLEEPVVIEEVLESESNADSPTVRFNRVDLLVKDSLDRRMIIEVQNTRESDYLERMLFGTSKVVTESVNKGEAYTEIPKVISIHILYFNLGTGTDYVYSGTTELKGAHTDEPLLVSERYLDESGHHRYRQRDVFPEYHVINVERFNKMDQEDLEMLDQWIYLFKQSEVRGDFNAPGMDTARQRLAYLKMSEQQRQRYDRHMMNFVREIDIMDTAHEEGRELGREEGRELGLEEGREEGRRQIVLRMAENGMDKAEIAKLTNLSEQEVSQLLAR